MSIRVASLRGNGRGIREGKRRVLCAHYLSCIEIDCSPVLDGGKGTECTQWPIKYLTPQNAIEKRGGAKRVNSSCEGEER